MDSTSERDLVILFVFVAIAIGVIIVFFSESNHSANISFEGNMTNSTKFPSSIIDNGINKTIIYTYPIKVGEYPVNKTSFQSVILNKEVHGTYVLLQLANNIIINSTDINIKPNQVINGTAILTKSTCDPDQLRHLFANGTIVQKSSLELETSNKYYFKEITNPYCKDGVEGLRVLNWNLLK